MFENEFRHGLQIRAIGLDFEIAKQHGLKETQGFMKSGLSNFLKLNGRKITTKTLNKLLKGDFQNYFEMSDYNNSRPERELEHYLIYRFNLDNETSIENCIIETI